MFYVKGFKKIPDGAAPIGSEAVETRLGCERARRTKHCSEPTSMPYMFSLLLSSTGKKVNNDSSLRK